MRPARVERGPRAGVRSIRGIRGANQVAENTEAAILSATRELLIALQQVNGFTGQDVISGIFTLTPDLNAAFPARAARDLGWVDSALLCAQEIPVPGSVPRIVRVLLHVRGDGPVQHVYLEGAHGTLRPDR
jgi:chorismate mutase